MIALEPLSSTRRPAVAGSFYPRGARELADTVDHVIHLSGLIDFFRKEKGERGETRIENLEELVSAARSFEKDPAEEMTELDAFLSHAALEAGDAQADDAEGFTAHFKTYNRSGQVSFYFRLYC